MNRSYRDKMDSVCLSALGKQRMLEALSAEKANAAPKPRRVLRTGLVAAVLLVLLTLAAGAALLLVPVLRDYYGGAGYDQSGSTLGHSVTQNGWTMTLTDCVGDDNYLYLGLELTAPKGTILDAGQEDAYQFKQYDFLFDNLEHQAMAWQLRQVSDDCASDNQLRFVLWIETRSDNGSLNGRQMELTVGKLYHFGAWDEAKRDYTYQYDCEETWDFDSLTISYPDNAIRLSPNTPVSLLDVTAILSRVNITPIGVTVEIKGDTLKGHHSNYGKGYCHALPEIVLYTKDGTVRTPDKNAAPFGVRGGSGCSGGSDKTEEGFLRIVQSYGYLLDLDSLDRIEICGVSIPLQ